MSDLNLVARHRAAAESRRHTIGNASAALAQFHTQTADELERLTAENAQLRNQRKFDNDMLRDKCKEIERLTKDNKWAGGVMQKQSQEIERLQARVEALEGAMREAVNKRYFTAALWVLYDTLADTEQEDE